jgi:hypothetical protein
MRDRKLRNAAKLQLSECEICAEEIAMRASVRKKKKEKKKKKDYIVQQKRIKVSFDILLRFTRCSRPAG